MPQNRHQQSKLFEGLRSNDLKNMISDKFTIDQYKSKMGKDSDIVVLAFRVKEKFPAIDAMEFVEKGYEFVLDADISAGEERDGKYSMFIEMERNHKVPKQIDELLKGLGKLCDCDNWRFKYHKDIENHKFSKEAIEKFVPLTVEAYKEKIKGQKISDISEILDQGVAEITDIDENNNMIIQKPFVGDLKLQILDMGDYVDVIKDLDGPIQLDESSNSQVLFLEKYLGNYEIHKIDNKFLIKNNDRAIVVSKGDW